MKLSWLPFLSLFSFLGAQPPLEVSHQARSLQPGEVVLIQARSSRPLARLKGTVFDRTFLFFPSGDPTLWQGLVGIDLETPAGSYPVRLDGETRTGQALTTGYALEVRAKDFPTRRLTVDERFVNPPDEVTERIQVESRKIREILSEITPERVWADSFRSPVPGAPTSGFGKRSILNGQPRSPHSGTDFDADEGTPIRAPSRGRVVLAENLYYTGNSVILDHGQGLYSFFAHLSRIGVERGQRVEAGEWLGDVGATGRVTGPHLHWSVRLAGTRVDPVSLMQLLPAED